MLVKRTDDRRCLVLQGELLLTLPLHCHYIASNEVGRNTVALYYLFITLITKLLSNIHWFDFGIRTTHVGLALNEQLYKFKHGFGSGSTCYDSYEKISTIKKCP